MPDLFAKRQVTGEFLGEWLSENTDPTGRESVSLGSASPLSLIKPTESKPQQTGTGLLIR